MNVFLDCEPEEPLRAKLLIETEKRWINWCCAIIAGWSSARLNVRYRGHMSFGSRCEQTKYQAAQRLPAQTDEVIQSYVLNIKKNKYICSQKCKMELKKAVRGTDLS